MRAFTRTALQRVVVVGGIVLLAGAIAVARGTEALAKPPKPNCPNCAPTVQIGGKTCTLVSCGFDCVYQCPF